MSRAEIVSAPVSAHGEGPIWDSFHRRLFWVDMMGRQLHALDPASGAVESKSFPDLVCAIAPTGSARLQVAFAKELAWVDWPSGAPTPIVAVEPDLPGNRCNDGKRDPAGRFWIGTMSRSGEGVGAGALYRLENDGTLTRVLSGLTIANGMTWSPDQRTMYFIDSPTREVWAFDFDPADSAISNRRTVVRVPESLGWPDGITIDDKGNLWVAHWGAGCVCRLCGPLGSKERPAPRNHCHRLPAYEFVLFRGRGRTRSLHHDLATRPLGDGVGACPTLRLLV